MTKLNPRQQQAVDIGDQHSLILAGAGTGKTKTIIARAQALIERGVPPKQILILAFTRRAAREIEARIKLALGSERVQGLNASTFHAWCSSLLRRAPKLFGFQNFSVIDRDDQIQLFKLMRGKRKKGSFPKAQELCDLYSYARNTRTNLSSVLEKTMPNFLKLKGEIAEVMRGYEQRKRQNNYLDYDDILDIVARGLAQYPSIKKWVGSQYRHILVDEMQDTNPIQWEILEPLSEYSVLFCVGDDAQSIYGFRGADFENVHDFKNRLPSSTVLKLEDNYRSTQEILDVSNWLLKQSPLKYDKELKSVRGKGIKPVLKGFDSEWTETAHLATDILERYDQGAPWSHHLVLIRTGFSGRNIEAAFIDAGIPYRLIGGTRLLQAAHVKDLLAILRVVANYRDEMAWMRFLSLWRGIGDKTAAGYIADMQECSGIDECYDYLSAQSKLESTALQVIEQVLKPEQTVSKMMQVAFKNLEEKLKAKYLDSDWEKRKLDFIYLEQLATKSDTILEFIERYVLDPIYDGEVDTLEEDDLVTISTIHSAKGTEREVVYVPSLSPGQYPSARSIDNDEVEEERRVLYVALTRAKDELIMSRSRHVGYIERSSKGEQLAESYFFNELPEHLVDYQSYTQDFEKPSETSDAGGVTPKISYGIDFD